MSVTKNKEKMFDQTTSLTQTYLRNNFLLGTRLDQLPTTVMLGDQLCAIAKLYTEDSLFNTFEWGAQNVVEVISLYLLHNMKINSGGSNLTLYEAIRSGQGPQLQEWINSTLMRDEVLLANVTGIAIRTNKKTIGMSGSCLYVPASYRSKNWQVILQECFDHIFGTDELGALIGRLLDQTHCPNALDILPTAKFTTLLNKLSGMKQKPTNMRNYFASRGMVYLDQSVFLKKGISCGCANVSYVAQTSLGITNPVMRKEVMAESSSNEYRDMVILNSVKLKTRGMFGYFIPSKLDEILNTTQFEVTSLAPAEIQRHCGISYSFGGTHE